jgi:rhamnosyl/mannosyltransferase
MPSYLPQPVKASQPHVPVATADVRRHRVLQISKFFPPVMGGIETVALEIAEGLHRAGTVADVLCSHQVAKTVDEQTAFGYTVVRAASLGRVLSTSMAPSMVTALRRLHAHRDIVHLHMPDPMAALAVLAIRPPSRLVVHWHSDVIRQRIAMHAYRHLQDWVLRRADAIIATSDAYAESSEALRPFRHKVVTIPIGLSAERYQPAPADVAAIRAKYPGKRIVYSLGRLAYYKGFDVLVRAATSLPDNCVVLIGGAGDLHADLERQIVSHGLRHKVHLLGHVPDSLVGAYFAACDVFCMPSTVRAEAYGVAIVEALMAGKPVVATDITGSGVPWVSKHRETGLNVPVANPVALAAALCTLLADTGLRRHYGQAASARYRREFKAEIMTQRILGLYQSLTHEPGVIEEFPFEPTQPVPQHAELTEETADVVRDATAAMPPVRRRVPVE